MLFNSFEFIFFFLPASMLAFFWLGRRSKEAALFSLLAFSILFYAWWSLAYLPLLIGSILFNYLIGRWLVTKRSATGTKWRKKSVLALGIVGDLDLLSYYKYANFFISNFNDLTGSQWPLISIVLPMGISFYTFTQIAFLVDAYQGKAKEYSLSHYGLFVTYFPHLIAGPILHYKEMMPQFSAPGRRFFDYKNISVGLAYFSFGLFKKLVLADGIGHYVAPVFDSGASPTLFDAWGGALAYTFQLYFDFSGYSDMAIGLSKLFGINLPFNFDSPYKARNIIDFWRRWHMTLSRFLRDYIYIPLGGNRQGSGRRYLNLMIAMLLGGLWHGAGWTFVIWGGLHGSYLVINHVWRNGANRFAPMLHSQLLRESVSWLLTLLAIIVGWVFFRSPDLHAAFDMLKGMAGLNGIALPVELKNKLGANTSWFTGTSTVFSINEWLKLCFWISASSAIIFCMPNTQEIIRGILDDRTVTRACVGPFKFTVCWAPNAKWAVVTSLMMLFAIAQISALSPFLYFQF